MIVGQIISLKQLFFLYVEDGAIHETELASDFPELNEIDTYEVMSVKACKVVQSLTATERANVTINGATILRCVETNTLYDIETSYRSFWCFTGDAWPEEYEVVG